MTTPTKPADPKQVWMKCRATPNCPGNYALVIWSKPVYEEATGSMPVGKSVRFRCLTCKQAWHVRS